MRTLPLIVSALGLLAVSSCTTNDPDLNPQPKVPPSASNQKPWNETIPGQGGGALGMMPQTPRR